MVPGKSSRATNLVMVFLAMPPVVVLFPFLVTPLIHVHVLSVSIVLPLNIAIVLRRALRPATSRNYGSSQ
jgi:hypothetical protein